MILIYNARGLLIGLLGAVIGLAAAVVSGMMGLAPLLLGAVWIGLGRRARDQHGQKGPIAHIFFIPLPILGVIALLLSVPTFFMDRTMRAERNDPRAAQLADDEESLKLVQYSGNLKLSRAIADHLIESSNAQIAGERIRVFTHLRGDAVLVLLQVPSLSRFQESARRQLLQEVREVTEKDPLSSGRKAYIAAKGIVAYGAMETPGQGVIVRTTGHEPLYPFYDAPVSTQPTSGPTQK